MMEWPQDIQQPVVGYATNPVARRSAVALQGIIRQFEVNLQRRYAPRDITGDGKAETFCNVFVLDVLRALECQVPALLRANDFVRWLGEASSWRPALAGEAADLVDTGRPVVAAWANPDGHPGHVAMLWPGGRGRRQLLIAQAGPARFVGRPITEGFGSRPVEFWTHP